MSYKLKVNLLIIFVLILLSILPVINLLQASDSEDFKFNRSTLFNIDVLITPIQQTLFEFGISLNSKQAYIGKEGWLYLGEQYASTVSTRRIGLTPKEVEQADILNKGLAQWDKYLKSRGVEAFHIMVGPDKATIYPEYLPDWAKPAGTVRTDALFVDSNSGLIFDTRVPLLNAKKINDNRLYYKTDTHWNNLGAWIAFDAFIKNLTDQGVIKGQFLSGEQVTLTQVKNRTGGDLSDFLKLKTFLADEAPQLEIQIGQDLNVEQIEYNTGETRGRNGNPNIGTSTTPLLTRNVNALNEKKVLWLRDSFGSAISPYMSATFSEVLQIHYAHVNASSLVDLVERFKPAYVFITVVERDLISLNVGLKILPPQFVVTNEIPRLGKFVSSTEVGLHHLEKTEGVFRVVNPKDPFIRYKLAEPISTDTMNLVYFKLECIELTENVNLQLFWKKQGDSHFNGQNSVRFKAETGDILVDLSSNDNWSAAEQIIALRIDLDSPGTCSSFSLRSPILLSK